jgi:hypothetical protein
MVMVFVIQQQVLVLVTKAMELQLTLLYIGHLIVQL